MGNFYFFIIYLVALRPNAGHGLLILDVSRSHTTTHRSRQDFSGRVISSSQRPLPDNTQHLQQTNIHAPGGIRAHDLSRRAVADLRLRRRGHWDRPYSWIPNRITSSNILIFQSLYDISYLFKMCDPNAKAIQFTKTL